MVVIYCLVYKPHFNVVYVTYSDTQAKKAETRARGLLGYKLFSEEITSLFPKLNSEQWLGVNGSSVIWRGRGGALTGVSADLIICDDLIKDPEEAASPAIKEGTWDWFFGVVDTRTVEGTSVIVNATRWAEDDIIGKLQGEDYGYSYINVPAISQDAEGNEKALWEAKQPLKSLEKKRKADPYKFSTMYQGEPRSPGLALFEGIPSTFEDQPANLQVSLGADFAYTTNGRDSDFSVVAALGKDAQTGRVFLLDMWRGQVRPDQFALKLKDFQDRFLAKIIAHLGPAERGVLDLLSREHSIRFDIRPARQDKFARAQDFANCWNRKEFFVRQSNPFKGYLIGECESFTATNSSHRRDDCVDAVSSAFAAYSRSKRSFLQDMDPELYAFLA